MDYMTKSGKRNARIQLKLMLNFIVLHVGIYELIKNEIQAVSNCLEITIYIIIMNERDDKYTHKSDNMNYFSHTNFRVFHYTYNRIFPRNSGPKSFLRYI